MNEKAENSAYNAWLLCMLDAQSLHVFSIDRSIDVFSTDPAFRIWLAAERIHIGLASTC